MQDGKTIVVNKAVEGHHFLSSKLSSKGVFCDSLTFNIKVLLPTHIQAPTLFVLYTKLFEGKLTKKLHPLMKKEVVNMNLKDSKCAQDFLKLLIEL